MPRAPLRPLLVAAAIALTGAAAAPMTASAHHGWSSYNQPVELEVEITEIILENPHDRLVVTDGDGVEWNILLAPRVRNQRFGFGEGVLAVGENVRLVGERHPSRPEAKIHQIWRDGEMVYEYMYDNGMTSIERQAARSRSR